MKCLQSEQAGKYKDHGFKNLHIVDLDGALTGKDNKSRYYSRYSE